MDKDQLSDLVSTLRDEWEATIAELGPGGLERPGAAGEWRVRDVLAHMNCWDRWQLAQLRCAFSGETPTDDELNGGLVFPPNDDMREDAMNAMFYAANHRRPLADIVADWREVSEMRTDWVANATQGQVDTVIGADWTSGTTRIFRLLSEVPSVSNPEQVWERICEQVAHARGHLDGVRGWMRG